MSKCWVARKPYTNMPSHHDLTAVDAAPGAKEGVLTAETTPNPNLVPTTNGDATAVPPLTAETAGACDDLPEGVPHPGTGITPAIIGRLNVDLGDYLTHFREREDVLPTDIIDYARVIPIWNTLDNIDVLSVGSNLQRSNQDEYYGFISACYSEAKRCYFEDNNWREAKVLILTAGKQQT